jgi:hypothetical protein
MATLTNSNHGKTLLQAEDLLSQEAKFGGRALFNLLILRSLCLDAGVHGKAL